MLRAWIVTYAFVGDPEQPTRFFRGAEWENAYLVMARMIWEVVRR